jgi:hypothetical protein
MTSNRYTVKLTFDDLDAKLRRSPERQRYFTVFVSECSQAVHSNTRRSRSGSSAGSSQPHRLNGPKGTPGDCSAMLRAFLAAPRTLVLVIIAVCHRCRRATVTLSFSVAPDGRRGDGPTIAGWLFQPPFRRTRILSAGIQRQGYRGQGYQLPP